MKIKYYLIALAGFMLAACNEELQDVHSGTGGGEGYGILKLTIDNRSKQTKAVGDLLPGLATPEEQKVEQVAFFVKTEASSAEAPGVFASFFSDAAAGSDQALSVPLKEEDTGLYTCQLKLQSPGWKNPQAIVIANYDEELGKRLKAVIRWDDLPALLATELTANGPQTPLLMYGRIDDLTAWSNSEGGVTNASIGLTRLVARIDVENYAYVDKPASIDQSGYVIDSMRLVRTEKTAYLLPPSEEELNALPVSTTGFNSIPKSKLTTATKTVQNAEGKDVVIQYVDTLYAYENMNTTPEKATALMIYGHLNGNPLNKAVEFLTEDTKKPIALNRNHRYLIKVMEGDPVTPIKYSVSVLDWGEGTEMEISPRFLKPVLENVKMRDSDKGVQSADGKTFTFTGSDAKGEKQISFEVLCPQNPGIGKVGFKYDTDGSSVSLKSDWISEVGEAKLVTLEEGEFKGETRIKRSFTVTVEQKTEQVPVHVCIPVYNEVAGKELADTITIRLVPFYQGDETLAAIPVYVAERYWAPVNVGATQVATKIETDLKDNTSQKEYDNTAQCGSYYQWGRNVAFNYYDAANNKMSIVTGPLTMEEAMKTTSFIVNQEEPMNWTSEPDMTLWNKGTEDEPVKSANDPCPDGWRVPTKSEWDRIMPEQQGLEPASTDNYKLENGVFSIKGDGDIWLDLPLGGWIINDGKVPDTGGMGFATYYWASTTSNLINVLSPMLQTDSSQPGKIDLIASRVRWANGCQIRCIQD